jgi:hypothetical protein
MSDTINLQALVDTKPISETNRKIGMLLCDAIEDEHFDLMPKPFNPRKVEVSLFVNGVEVPFMSTLTKMIEQFDALVNKEAEGRVIERIRELKNAIDRTVSDFFELTEEDR